MSVHATAKEKAENLKWETESDLRTLRTAQDIKADKGRMDRAMAMAKKELAAIKKVRNG